MKLVTWEDLKISQTEIENILKFNFFDNLAVEMANLLIIRHSKNKLSFLFLEAIIAFLSILFLVPINLLFFQQWFSNSNQLKSFSVAIMISVIVSLVFLLCLNLYLWQKAKKLKKLATIVNKIKNYNHLIQNFQLLIKFNNLSTLPTSDNFDLSSEIGLALKATKESLLNSLEIEKLVIQNKVLQLYSHYQLLNNLEEDLVSFLSLQKEPRETEYQQLLSEVVKIGLSVHQEVRKNINFYNK